MHWFDFLAYSITGVCLVAAVFVGVSAYKFYKNN